METKGAPHRRRLRWASGGALLVLLALAATAYAAQPVKGGVYEGNREVSPYVDFQVSPDGKSVLDFRAVGVVVPCSFPRTAFEFPSHAKIIHGGFKIPAHGGRGDVATITGRFLAGGGVSLIAEATGVCENSEGLANGRMRHLTQSFSATARPDGGDSTFCLDHSASKGTIPAEYVVAVAVSCEIVKEALEAGTYSMEANSFMTPGWTCKPTGEVMAFKCSRDAPEPSFSFKLGHPRKPGEPTLP